MKKLKITSALLSVCMLFSIASCSNNETKSTTAETTVAESSEETASETTAAEETTSTEATEATEETNESAATDTYWYEGMTTEEIVASLTLEQKAAQMVEPAFYNLSTEDEKNNCYGSILSKYDMIPQFTNEEWVEIVDSYQEAALQADNGLPYVYGQDSVHGVNFASNCVIFPHNINIGAANDVELTRLMGELVGSDVMHTKMIFNFSPCVAAAQDPRWGRTYESYSSEPSIITPLAVAYSEGLISEGILPCAKHFICDGYALYGTGEDSGGTHRLIDRGDAILSDEVIEENLAIYQALIDSGVKTIMLSHSSLNGTKMHENSEYIAKIKNEMGFTGFIISDWDSIENCSGESLKDNVILCINAGIDMLMEADHFKQCRQYIIEGVNEGSIPMDRVDDAVTRILNVKREAGLFDDPFLNNFTPSYEWNSEKSQEVACKLAEESFVPLKADGGLTIEPGSRVFVTGPAANDTGVMAGGWTYTWLGESDANNYGLRVMPNAVTIQKALEAVADTYDLTIVTKESEIDTCNVVLLCLGEQPYAEWVGDAEDLSITGDLGLDDNASAIELAKESNLPTITLLVAGRNVIIEDYINDWDSVIMCYLPGSEGGRAIANMLTGQAEYTGKLAMPYYKSESDIDNGKIWLPVGFTAAPEA